MGGCGGALPFRAADAWASQLPGVRPRAWAPDGAVVRDWASGLEGAFDTFWLSDGLERDWRGDVLADFLADYGITPYRLAKDTGMPPTRPGAIINDGRAITADTALRLGKYFGNTPEFWTNLQAMHDIRELLLEKRAEFEQIRTIAETKAS